jgi:DNA-binding IclR family transcriptional regulator
VLLDHPENSLSCAELALSSGVNRQTCQWNIHQLRRRQFVTGSGSPARFALVDATDTEQALARSWRRRPPSA